MDTYQALERLDGLVSMFDDPQDIEAMSVIRSEVSRLRASRDALAELVRLKDGPRDAQYQVERVHAWDAARRELGTAQKA